MHGLCLGFHKWDGCTCTRCGQTRDRDHPWSGCVCSRCGTRRDAEHDWEILEGCERRCRRCHRHTGPAHDLANCVCRVCGAVLHLWKAGTCQRCGLVCDHPRITTRLEGDLNDETIHATVLRVCEVCAEPMGQVWKK